MTTEIYEILFTTGVGFSLSSDSEMRAMRWEWRSWSKELANVDGFPVESDLRMEPTVETLSFGNEIWDHKCHFYILRYVEF